MNHDEIVAAYKLQDPDNALLGREVKGKGGFQSLIRGLQRSIYDGFLVVTLEQLERMARHSVKYGPGGFQGRLRDLTFRVATQAGFAIGDEGLVIDDDRTLAD